MLNLRTILTAVALPLLAAFPAAYGADTGSSSAYGVSVKLDLLPTLGSPVHITAGPLPTVSGMAPAPYNATNQVAAADVGFGLLIAGNLRTGVLTVNAASNLPNTNGTSANATVNNTNALLASLAGLTADVIGSSVSTGGNCGALTATGSTVLVRARLNGVTLDANPAPNTVVFNAGGVKVILNEQIPGMNGPTQASLTVNAIHIVLTNAPLGLGLISGDIVIAQSQAALQCSNSSADLSMQLDSTTSPVHVGSGFSYRIYVTNNGPDPATDVVVTDNLPPGVTFVSASTPQGSCQGTTTVTCNLGSIPAGTFVRIAIFVTVQGPNVSDSASATANEFDPNLSNNTATTNPPFAP